MSEYNENGVFNSTRLFPYVPSPPPPFTSPKAEYLLALLYRRDGRKLNQLFVNVTRKKRNLFNALLQLVWRFALLPAFLLPPSLFLSLSVVPVDKSLVNV